MSEELLTSSQLEAIGERALTFQRYVFRRAYGTYYAVWALAIAVFVLLPFGVYGTVGFTDTSGFLVSAADILIAVAATLVSVRNFGGAARTIALRNALRAGKPLKRSHRLVILWWATFIAVVSVAYTFSSLVSFSLIYGMLLSIVVFLVTRLRQAFPDKVPPEGKLSVVVYGASATLSFALSVSGVAPAFSGLPWIAMIATWLFSSIYALKHAPEELVELRC